MDEKELKEWINTIRTDNGLKRKMIIEKLSDPVPNGDLCEELRRNKVLACIAVDVFC